MPEHGYQQHCALARALDVAGGRWTLLIVRELIPGPRRFTDLIAGLPGVSRNLLTERLRDLEREGIVTTRQLPPPAARGLYELTDDGRDLAAALTPLMAWGARRMTGRTAGDAFHPRWAAVGMCVFADGDVARGVTETYQFFVGDTAFHFAVADGAVRLRDGYADDPAVTWSTDEETWSRLASGEVAASAAVGSGAVVVVGDPAASRRLGRVFSRNQAFALAHAAATHEQ